MIVVKLIMRNLTRIAKNNSVIATTTLSVKARAFLKKIVLTAREEFLSLMNVTHHLKQEIVRKRAKSQRKKIAKDTSIEIQNNESQESRADLKNQVSQSEASSETLNEAALDDDRLSSQIMFEKKKMTALSNVHVALHFKALTQKYELL